MTNCYLSSFLNVVPVKLSLTLQYRGANVHASDWTFILALFFSLLVMVPAEARLIPSYVARQVCHASAHVLQSSQYLSYFHRFLYTHACYPVLTFRP